MEIRKDEMYTLVYHLIYGYSMSLNLNTQMVPIPESLSTRVRLAPINVLVLIH